MADAAAETVGDAVGCFPLWVCGQASRSVWEPDGHSPKGNPGTGVDGPAPGRRLKRWDHLPEREREAIRRRFRAAWAETDHVPAGGPRRRPSPLPVRLHPQATANPPEHEPLRVDNRDRPPRPAKREALATGRHGPPLDGRRDARSRDEVPTDRRLPAPGRARDRSSASHRPPRRRPLRSCRPDHHREPLPTKFHISGTSSSREHRRLPGVDVSSATT